jgi:hypothetical protein
VEELIRADRRITVDSVATALGLSHGLAMLDLLKLWKACTQRVPTELNDCEKVKQMGLSLQHILQYAYEGEDRPNRIVTGGKSWGHHYQPKSKCASVQGKHPNSPETKKFKVTSMPSPGKVVLTMFKILREYCSLF